METALQTNPLDFASAGVAHRLINNDMDANALRTNALLRDDEWKRIDDSVLDTAKGRLRGIQDLRDAGLTRDLGGLGVLIAEYEKVSDMEPAEQSLSGVTEGQEDIPEFTLAGVPVPITHKDFRINVRHLQASRTRGSTIDVTAAEAASRQVAELLESTLFNGSAMRIGTSVLQGYRNFTDRITGSVSAAWDGTATGEQMVADVIAAIGDAEAANFFGPFVLYLGTATMTFLREDFKANSDKTVMQRMLELEPLSAIRHSSKMTAGEFLLVQLTSDVIDLPVGQDITTVEWDTKGGLSMHFKVMAAMAPRLKSDANSNTGIVHYT